MERVVWLAVFVAVAGSSVWGQSITTDSNIETDGQLVSKVGSGTPPLAVSSNTTVRNLSADLLDGKHGNDFALYAELLAAIQSLDNPDPPCFSNTHRFVNCSNGTVTDGANGLIWLENAGCLGELDWAAASQAAALLFDGATIDSGGGDCGLSDGSRPGDWRLPTREEWEEIVDASCLGTGIPLVGNGSPDSGCYGDNAWATGVAPFTHWSSRTAVYNPTVATRRRFRRRGQTNQPLCLAGSYRTLAAQGLQGGCLSRRSVRHRRRFLWRVGLHQHLRTMITE
jgi:hypothetical protein